MLSAILSAGLLASTAIRVLANPLPAATSTAASTCATGVHMIVVHGSTETGYGDLDSVVEGVLSEIPGSDSEYIVYPATLLAYAESEAIGVSNTTLRMQEYSQECPDTSIVLMGYSQGAQAVMDTLCGSTALGADKGSATPISSEYTTTLSAVINWGDPSYVLGQTYDVGTATMGGIFPRQNVTACDPYASIIQSYCDEGDPFCASGDDVNVHYSYGDVYTDASVAWIVAENS